MGTVQNVTELGGRICENLIQCARKLKLYPRAHPRVEESLQAIRADLVTYAYESGRPFSMSTSATLEESVGGRAKKVELADVLISRSLKLHLVESVMIHPEATDDELTQFCSLLERDNSKVTESDETDVDPEEWDGIRLAFYTPKDYPGVFPTTGAPLERAAGVRRLKDIQELVGSLREDLRAPLEKALTDTSFLQRVSTLRRTMRKQRAAFEQRQGKKIDLFGEVVRSVLSSPDLVKDPESAPEKIVTAVQNLVEFLEKNLDGLSLSLRTSRDGQDPDSISRQIDNTLDSSEGLSNIVNAFQIQKQRLAFLFHTAPDSGASAKGDAAGASGPPAERGEKPLVPAKTEGEGRQVAAPISLEERLGSITYDANRFLQLLEEDNPHENYVQVVAELISTEDHKANISKAKGTIAQTIVQTCANEARLEKSVASLCELHKSSESKNVEDLIVDVLYRLSPAELTLRLLENVVLKIGGPMRAATCLIRLTEKDPKRAVGLLFTVHRVSRSTLRSIAEARLISMAAQPELVVHWAKEYPDGLMMPQIISKVLGSLGSERTLKAFRVFFGNSGELQASRVISELPPNIPEGESVLFAALEAAPPPVRRLAIANLGKYPTPAVIATLTEILKANNYKKTPEMEEVDAVLKALSSMKNEKVTAFLRAVVSQRSGLLHVYRKEIRRAVRGLAARLVEQS